MNRWICHFWIGICLVLGISVSTATVQAAPPPRPASSQAADRVGEPKGAATATEESSDGVGDKDEAAPPEFPKGPLKMTVAVALESVSELKLDTGTFVAVFYAEMVCDQPCKPELEAANGELVGKPEKILDEKAHKLYKYKARLNAIIDLKEYPYDRHILPIILEDRAHLENVELTVDKANSKVDADVAIPGWSVVQGDVLAKEEEFHGHKIKQVMFGVEIKRPPLTATFKSIVPVIALLFVAAFALLLKPKSAQARLNAAAGGLIPVVMFQVGQINSLPPLGYLTRLDKFMFAVYIVYLVHIALSVAMLRLDEKKNEKGAELAHLLAAGAVPGVALVGFLLVFLKYV